MNSGNTNDCTQGRLAAVIFDLDGVVVHSPLDFVDISRRIFGESAGGPLLERIERLESAVLRSRAHRILEQYEDEAARSARLNHGMRELLACLKERRIKTAIATRNTLRTVQTICRRFGLCFDAVVTRADATPKPSPKPILLACERLKVPVQQTLMVGDYEFDMQAGRAAGAATVLLRTALQSSSRYADATVGSLDELKGMIAADCRDSRRAENQAGHHR